MFWGTCWFPENFPWKHKNCRRRLNSWLSVCLSICLSVLSVGILVDIMCFWAHIRYLEHPQDIFYPQLQLWDQRSPPHWAAAAAASALEASGNGMAAGFMVITVWGLNLSQWISCLTAEWRLSSTSARTKRSNFKCPHSFDFLQNLEEPTLT